MAGFSRPILGRLRIQGRDGDVDFPFQFMPDNISDTKSAQWAETGIVGRSSPLYAYGGASSRQINLVLEFFAKPQGGSSKPSVDDLKKIARQLRALVYPQLGGGAGSFSLLSPPVVVLDLNWYRVRCVVNNVDVTYSMPWDSNRNEPHYMKATIQLLEVAVDPLMYDDVVSKDSLVQ